MTDRAPIAVNARIAALKTAERAASGDQLTRIRRQISMLTEDDRPLMPLPEPRRRFE